MCFLPHEILVEPFFKLQYSVLIALLASVVKKKTVCRGLKLYS